MASRAVPGFAGPHYRRDDMRQALERAVRFGAFSLAAVQRILGAQAQPKPLLEELAEAYGEALDPRLREEPVGPRPTSAYQHLLTDEKLTDEHPQTPFDQTPSDPTPEEGRPGYESA
jgi:hypothetical protein